MVVGCTSSSISKAEIFNTISETEVLTSVFPDIKSLPCLMCSPLRVDKKPSFSIYMSSSGHIYFKDHATNEGGSLLDLLCSYWGCTFRQALDRIANMAIDKKEIVIRPKHIKVLTRKEAQSSTNIQVAVRPWRDYDYEYWAEYGVTPKALKYAEVYPISHKIIYKKDLDTQKTVKYIVPAEKYAYCFVERKEGNLQLKIYQPFSKKYKWCSKMDGSVIGLWSKVPEHGKSIVICSSLKDALCLSCQCKVPAICLQGEGYNMSNTAISELKRRYKNVYILFDNDKAGIADARKLSEATGFINIVLPKFKGGKDISDYYKCAGKDMFYATMSRLLRLNVEVEEEDPEVPF